MPRRPQLLDHNAHGLPLLPGHQLRHQLHNGDLRAVGGEGAGQLQTDDTTAHDHHGAGQRPQIQRAGGVDAQLVSRNGNGHGLGAGGDDDVLTLILPAAAGDNPPRLQHGLAGDDLHPLLFQQELHAAHQLAGDLGLSRPGFSGS